MRCDEQTSPDHLTQQNMVKAVPTKKPVEAISKMAAYSNELNAATIMSDTEPGFTEGTRPERARGGGGGGVGRGMDTGGHFGGTIQDTPMRARHPDPLLPPCTREEPRERSQDHSAAMDCGSRRVAEVHHRQVLIAHRESAGVFSSYGSW